MWEVLEVSTNIRNAASADWLGCIECVHNLLDRCPACYSRNNAACLTLSKSITDVDKKLLRKEIEKKYKQDLIDAAKMYHARMAMAGINEREDVVE